MKLIRFGIAIFAISWAIGVSITGQEQQPPEQQQAELPVPAPLPRVVGQVNTEEEHQAWLAVVGAEEAQKPQMAKNFLSEWPESGMTPHAHYIIALKAYAAQEYSDFVMHGEAALKELPSAVDLSSSLAFYFAETKKYDQAISYAEKLIQAISTIERPDNLNAAQWAQNVDQLQSTGYYAMGRSQLGKFVETEGAPTDDPVLLSAISNLSKAVTANPVDDYAHFRLGAAYQAQEEYDKAVVSFARAAATQGPAAGPAKSSLIKILEFKRKDPSEAEKAIAKELDYLKKQLLAKQSEYQKAAQAAAQSPPPQQ